MSKWYYLITAHAEHSQYQPPIGNIAFMNVSADGSQILAKNAVGNVDSNLYAPSNKAVKLGSNYLILFNSLWRLGSMGGMLTVDSVGNTIGRVFHTDTNTYSETPIALTMASDSSSLVVGGRSFVNR